MAITDIIERIETDATAEAGSILAAAEAEAARLLADAEATIAAERAQALETAGREAAEEAGMLLANARLAARDVLLTEKRALAERVLERAGESLAALPDAQYLEFIAAGVQRAAAGGETLAIAPADTKRLGGLAETLAARGVSVTPMSEPAPIARGVLLTGDRVRVEVSPAATIADRRDDLLLMAARELFGGKE